MSDRSKMRMVAAGIVLNFVCILGFAGLYIRGHVLSPLGPSACYTELDRAGVIDHKALRTFDPTLESNDRYRVPQWIAESPLNRERANAAIGGAMALLNLVVLAAVRLCERGAARRLDRMAD